MEEKRKESGRKRDNFLYNLLTINENLSLSFLAEKRKL